MMGGVLGAPGCDESVCIPRRLLPSLEVVAVSQAPSPESSPDSPLPVITMVGHDPTIELIGQKFEWRVALAKESDQL